MLSTCVFSIEHWQDVLGEALDMGYRFCFHDDYAAKMLQGERTILLRHNIDISLEKALLLAEAEKAMGVKATYFVYLNSSNYRISSVQAKKQIRRIVRLGNEVGLYYKPQYYIGRNRAELLAQDVARLSEVTRRRVKVCSAHRVGNFSPLGAADIKMADMEYEAYEPRFFRQVKYISDSDGRWREGCLCRWLGREDRLIVLTHPIWWLGLGSKAEE